MKPEVLYQQIRKYCEKNFNEANIKKYSRYFKEGFDSYGLSKAQIDELTDFVITNSDGNLKMVLDLCILLVSSGKYEEAYLAVRMVKHFSIQHDRTIFHEIEKWFNLGIHNWANCDGLCGELISGFLIKDIINFKDLTGWKNSKNKFQRRAVPVSLIKVIKEKGGHTDFLNFLNSMMMDTDREVHQGLGWFLREAWKLNREVTESFLFKWKDKSPRLIFQYATEKMTKEERLKFRKVK